MITTMQVLEAFAKLHISATVKRIHKSPQVTQYICGLGDNGKGLERFRKVRRDAVDLAMLLGVPGLQVVAMPKEHAFALEIPNEKRIFVHLRKAMLTRQYIDATREPDRLPVVLGVTDRDVLIGDLTEMPHLLIAGATGSGKSELVKTIIKALMITQSPEDVQFLLIDPKQVELNQFAGDPHLVQAFGGIISDPLVAGIALTVAVNEMTDRYELFRQAGVTNITEYRKQGHSMARKIIVIDELADLMFSNRANVENKLVRLAQLGRGAGMHLIVATQRPSVDVVTGLIKANFPTRIALKVASKTDSRVILDQNGAEALLGKGDLLYKSGDGTVTRAQGCYS